MDKLTVQFKIDGMSCGGCVKTVRNALEAVEGVTVHSVEIGYAEVEIDPAEVSKEQLVGAIDDTGFTVLSAG